MARDDNNEQAVTYNIPRNYFTKGRIGDVISFRGLVEGGIMSVPFVKLISMFPIPKDYRMTGYIVVVAVCLLVGAIGYNGEYPSEFAITLVKFFQRKRIAYYNPRIKLEAEPEYLKEKERKILPRERIMQLLKREEVEDELQDESEEEYAWDSNEVFFEDDIGYKEKPEALKTAAEKKKEREEAEEEARQERLLRKAEQRKARDLEKRLKKLEKEKRREAKKKKKAGDIRPVEIIEIEPVSEIAQENEPEVIEVIEETPVIETITPVEDENEKVQEIVEIKEIES